MHFTKSTLLLAAAVAQVSAFNYNVTLTNDDSGNNVCVEVLGDETSDGVYPVKCPAVCGQLENNEFNAGQCEGTTGANVFAHVNSENNVDYLRISNQYNYRFPCQSQGTSSSSSKTFLCQGWLDPPSTASTSATSFVTFTTGQPSATQTSAVSSASSTGQFSDAQSSFISSASSVIASVLSSLSPTTTVSSIPSIPTATPTDTSSVGSVTSSVITTATSDVVTASSAVPSASASSGSCTEGSKGKGLGDGYRGYCCSSNNDCWNRCKRGVCNGPLEPPASPTVTPTNCKKGTEGEKKGDGLSGDCCYSSADCKDKCVNGTCNAPRS